MIKQGNALEVLKEFDDNSIDCCITSPPYFSLRLYSVPCIWDAKEGCEHDWGDKIISKLRGAEFEENSDTKHNYAKACGVEIDRGSFCKKCGAWYGELGGEPDYRLYISHLISIFNEVRRVLKKDGTCWVVIGDSYAGSNSGYGDKWAKRRRAIHDVQDGYLGSSSGKPPTAKIKSIMRKSQVGIPERFKIAMIDSGWGCFNTIIWKKPNPVPFSGKDRFTVDFEYVYAFMKNPKHYFKQQFEPSVDPESYSGKRPRNASKIYHYDPKHYAFKGSIGDDGRMKYIGKKYPMKNKRCVWEIPTACYKGNHFAVFPERLVEIMIDAGCPENGIVLDPFAGHGTTGVVALKMNRKFIGIELNSQYCEDMKKRLEREVPLLMSQG